MSQSSHLGTGQDPLAFLAGGGEMGERTRAFDWGQTPVGPAAAWPQSLKTVVRIMLDSRYAMWLGWGPGLTFFYNDAYAAMTLGPKHPWALGRPAREVWSEIWADIGPRAESVVRTGQATWDEKLLLFLERRKFKEETYHTFSYSPVPDDQGGIGGMLCVVTEDTERTIAERRLRTLRELATKTNEKVQSAEEACETAARTLAENSHDLPFALIYLLDPEAPIARLAGAAGLQADSAGAPASIDLSVVDPFEKSWPMRAVLDSGQPKLTTQLEQRFGAIRCGVWPEPPQQAVVLPLGKPGQTRLAGFAVAGVSPRLVFDDGYRGFMDLLAGQIATAIANARAYEEERQRVQALAELDRAKTAFFSNVSHEFRTPLTLMLGPLQEALSRPAGDVPVSVLAELSVAHRNSLRLLKLVNALLDFSRIEAARVQPNYEPTDLAALTCDLASAFRSAIERANLRLVLDCPTIGEPAFVDREMWEKIILNLLSNAFKYTFEGEIAVTLRRVGDDAEVSVRDTGTGIPAHELPRLFERFHRIQGARARTHEGTGIGLALVQELVKLHGGNIRVESQVDRGTTFFISIPLGSAHLPAERVGTGRSLASIAIGPTPYLEEASRWLPDAPATDHSSITDADAVLRDVSGAEVQKSAATRILVADDNEDLREYLRRLLASQYDVEVVSDGQFALEAARRRKPDLILTDVMMPRLDGFGLLREVRDDPALRDTPVIVLSARAGEEARVEGAQAGADDYLVKPFSARELLARVGALVEKARLRREVSTISQEQRRILELIARGEPRQQCLEQICLAIELIDPAARACILLAGNDQARFVEVVAPHLPDFVEAIPKLPIDGESRSPFGGVLQRGETLCCPNIVGDSRWSGNWKSLLLDHEVRAAFCYPVGEVASAPAGLVLLCFEGPKEASDRDQRLSDMATATAGVLLRRDQSDRALRQSEERLRAVVETTPECVKIVAPDGSLLYMNAAGLEMVEAESNAVLGANVIDLVAPEHREGWLARHEQICNGERVAWQFEIIGQKGTRRWMETHAVPLPLPDGRVAQLAVTRDVSERKRAEEREKRRQQQLEGVNIRLQNEVEARRASSIAEARLSAIVESSDDAIISKTLDGIITSWNAGARAIFGYSADEVIGQSILIVVPPERHEEEANILRRLRNGERINHFETERLRKDGSRVEISLSVSPVRDASGTIVGASKIAREITEKKLVEREKEKLLEAERHAREEAQRINRLKDEFLATLSHELRTPLNAIMGWSQMMGLGTMTGEDMKEAGRIIERNSRTQKQLIDDLLDMSRIVAGKLRLELQAVDPLSFIEAAIETVRPSASVKDIRVEHLLDPLAGPISGDPARLQQVLWNLLSNAVKFTPKGGRIQVRLERVNSNIEITVSDTGQGIDPEFLPHLFERFRQADASTTRRYGGLGIGLAIAKEIIELHGGTIRAKSAGEGATFVLTLPVLILEGARGPARVHPTAPSAIPLEAGLTELSGLKVLFVDDEPDARGLVKRLLEECGAEVITAPNAQEALDLSAQCVPDIVISDIGMPDIDGYEFLRKLRASNQLSAAVPAIALTAFARSEDRTRALRAGFISHVAKPIEPSELLATVAVVAGRISEPRA
jgi:PAS domain S-box-containing protein